MFLLDTNIISELRKPKPHGGVVTWVAKQETAALFISAMSIAEIQRGIEKTRENDPEKAAQIEAWLLQLIGSGQVLPMDAGVCREWARIMLRRSGTLVEDAFIAATATVHRLTVVTRNVRDFKVFEVKTFNPFESK
ncbi:MAG: type II toxin-antitoxin system VapC family toxin [Burkholderiales bacterium]